jgi:hypothetical protein
MSWNPERIAEPESISPRNKKDLESLTGLDSNILVYALDPLLPEHQRAKRAILGLNYWYVNPTVIHEAYHTGAGSKFSSFLLL